MANQKEELLQFNRDSGKKTWIKQFRFTDSQIKRLKMLAEASGFNTVSAYARHRLFNEISADIKLNEILKFLKEKEGSKND